MPQVPCVKLQRGDSIDYTPGTNKKAGDVVVLGTRLIGVVSHDVAAHQLGALDVANAVFRAPKVTGAITKGTALHWDHDANPVGGTAGTGAFTTNAALGPFAGFAVSGAASGDSTVHLRLASLDAGATTLRSALGQDDLAVYDLDLLTWHPTDSPAVLGAAAGTPAGAFGVTVGTHGAAAPKIVGEAASGNTKTNRMRRLFTLPPEYVAGETVTLRIRAVEGTAPAEVSTTVDAEVYKTDRDGGLVGGPTDLCATNLQDVTDTVGNKDFTITPTGLAPGDELDIEITGVTTDTGGTNGTVLTITQVSLLLDVKG